MAESRAPAASVWGGVSSSDLHKCDFLHREENDTRCKCEDKRRGSLGLDLFIGLPRAQQGTANSSLSHREACGKGCGKESERAPTRPAARKPLEMGA